MNARVDLQAYAERGWALVRVPPRQKGPRRPKWNKPPFDAWESFGDHENVGVVLGEPSKGLVDVDLDCPEAVQLAPTLLPETEAIHGRPGNPRSHYWYQVSERLQSRAFRAAKGGVLLELRSTGGQTLVPPSRHPSGEAYVWHAHGSPARISSEVVARCVKELAVAVRLLKRAKREGSVVLRGAASALLSAGWSWKDCQRLLAPVGAALSEELQWLGDSAPPRRGGAATESTRADLNDVLGPASRAGDERRARVRSEQAKDLTGSGRSPRSQELARLEELVQEAPRVSATWAWLGYQAAREGVHATCQSLVPPQHQGHYAGGATMFELGGTPGTPFERALRARFERALKALGRPKESLEGLGLTILDVEHRQRALDRGGEFNLQIETRQGRVWIRSLTGGELRSYAKVANRAAECGLLLPDLSRQRVNKLWLAALEPAFVARTVISLAPDAELEFVVEEAVSEVLGQAERGISAEDLDRGAAVLVKGSLVMRPSGLVDQVRRLLCEDNPSRQEVLTQASRLGGVLEPQFRVAPGEPRRRVLVFPVPWKDAGEDAESSASGRDEVEPPPD